MKFHAFFLLSIALTLLLTPQSADAQKVTVRVPPADYQGLCEIPSGKFLPLTDNIAKYGAPAFYQYFMVFGDGNYYYRRGEMGPDPSSSMVYTATNPYLPDPGFQYFAEGILIDRKSDTEPPSMVENINLPPNNPLLPSNSGTYVDAININPNSTDPEVNKSPALIPPISDLKSDCQRVALAHSHEFIEENDWSSFILAYHPRTEDMEVNIGKILFFLEDPFDDGDFQTHLPNYRVGTAPTPMVNLQHYPLGAAYSPYRHVIVYDIDRESFEFDDPADGLEELRLFHFIRALSASDGFDAGKKYNFMMVLASEYPTGDVDYRSCAEENYKKDYFARNYVGNTTNNFEILPFAPNVPALHYIDADSLVIESGKPKDPNRLEVMHDEICECENGNYRVPFELTFCNIAPFPTTSSSLFITNEADPKLFKCFEPVLAKSTFSGGFVVDPLKDCGATPKTQCPNCQAKDSKCSAYNFCNNCDAQYCVGYSPIMTKGAAQKCHTFRFVAQTNQDGIQQLLENYGVMKACVNFHETECEYLCSYSDSLKVEEGFLDIIPSCSNLSPAVTCNDCPVIDSSIPPWPPHWVQVLIGILILGLIVFGARRLFWPGG